jgi:hypothetical protein
MFIKAVEFPATAFFPQKIRLFFVFSCDAVLIVA